MKNTKSYHSLNESSKIASEALAEKFGKIATQFPELPLNTLAWIEKARPNIGRVSRNFDLIPFWLDIYEDNHPDIMVVAGRQTFKTTLCTDKLANVVTALSRVEGGYVTDSEAHLSAFSKQRFRIETFQQNPILRQYLRHDRGNIGEISLGNDSTAYLVTDEGEYKKVEGKSLKILMLDETQYQDVQFLAKAIYALFQTHGRIYKLGIGGEAGSEYYNMWHKTDQREWVYEDKFWYEKIQRDANGNVINSRDELKAILAGRWIPQKPENTQFRGYHLPQTIFPTIPRTIAEAQLYNINPQFSIEFQQRYSPQSYYVSHCLGEFYKAERRPITPEMVEACYLRYLRLLRADEVRELKAIFGNEILVLGGVDYGSGPANSQTVASVIIYWKKANRYQLAWIDPRPQEHQLDQARYLSGMFNDYGIDFGVGDLGYGQIQVKLMQDGGRDSKDRQFEGLGKRRFVGCRTIGDETKPQQKFSEDVDEHGTELGRIQIDKTTTIQNFVDFVGTYVAHPLRPLEENWKRTQFIIPFANEYETDWLKADMVSLTRKDLEKDPDVTKEDPRQKARKEFNHPPDSVMSIIYCLVARNNYDASRYKILGTRRER